MDWNMILIILCSLFSGTFANGFPLESFNANVIGEEDKDNELLDLIDMLDIEDTRSFGEPVVDAADAEMDAAEDDDGNDADDRAEYPSNLMDNSRCS